MGEVPLILTVGTVFNNWCIVTVSFKPQIYSLYDVVCMEKLKEIYKCVNRTCRAIFILHPTYYIFAMWQRLCSRWFSFPTPFVQWAMEINSIDILLRKERKNDRNKQENKGKPEYRSLPPSRALTFYSRKLNFTNTLHGHLARTNSGER